MVVLIDVQSRFLDGMQGSAEPILARLEQLLIICEWFELPLVATFEEPVALKGRLPARLQAKLPSKAQEFAKTSYAISGEEDIAAALRRLGRPKVAVAGSETDVCVMQSVLGLRDSGYEVLLLEDCLFSSEPNTAPALLRMRSAGAIPCTYKMLLYELLQRTFVGPPEAAEARAVQRGFVPPESLPLLS